MAILRTSMVDLIEVAHSGHIRVRMKKLALDGDQVLSWGYHRFMVHPGANQEKIFTDVGAHLRRMKTAGAVEAQWNKVRPLADSLHTDDAVAAFKERARRIELGENPDDDLDGEVVLRTVALQYQTPADPVGRIDRLILADAARFISGFEPSRVGMVKIEEGADIVAVRAEVDAHFKKTVRAKEWQAVAAVDQVRRSVRRELPADIMPSARGL